MQIDEKIIEEAGLAAWKSSALNANGVRNLDAEWTLLSPADRAGYYAAVRAAINAALSAGLREQIEREAYRKAKAVVNKALLEIEDVTVEKFKEGYQEACYDIGHYIDDLLDNPLPVVTQTEQKES
jgi:hypothetical protein